MSKIISLKNQNVKKKLREMKQIYILLLFEAAVVFFVHIFHIGSLYGFFLSEDELGYWGNAAFLLGKNWGNTVSYCGYYSFGYSLFLMLILSLPVKALTMYRMAIIANALFMVASFLISYYLFTYLFKQKNRIFISIACMAMALYSSYVAQSSVAWSECYLILFAWLIVLQSYMICKKMTALRLIVFAVELIYIYMIHQRTVPFLIAGIFLILLINIYNKKINIRRLTVIVMVMIIAMTILLCLSEILGGYIQSEIYSFGTIANTYSAIVKGMELSNLFIPVVRSATGQIFYLWAASFGIIPLGIGVTVKKCIKKWKEQDKICCFYVFVLLVFFGLLGVSSIFLRLSVTRIDYLIYGRYIEIISGYFIVVGFLELEDFVKQKKNWIIFGISSIGFIILALLLLNKIRSWNIPLSDYQGVCAAGTFWFYSLKEFSVMQLCAIVLLAEMLLFTLARLWSNKNRIFILEVFFIMLFWIAAGKIVVKNQICPYQDANNRGLAAKDSLWKYMEEHVEQAVFLTNTQYNLRGSLQFYLGKTPLFVVSDMEELDDLPDVLIVDNDSSAIDNGTLDKYHYVCCVSQKNVYILNEISLDGLGEQISEIIPYHNYLKTEESGHVAFGPYIRLEAGTYEVTFQMNASTDGRDILGMMDVVNEKGENVICSTDWDGVSQSVSMKFHLEERVDNVEFRYFKNAGNDTVPLKIMLRIIKESCEE